MMLSPAEQHFIEAIRHVCRLHADRGQCEVRIARKGEEFSVGSGTCFDTAWRDIAEDRARRAG
jgi:hypothetical protein